MVGNIEYTNAATITYSEIIFTTQSPPSMYINQVIPINIWVGTIKAICLSESCSFIWAESVTPYLDSVQPSSITGPSLLTLTGRNLVPNNESQITTVQITIDNEICNVTLVSNSTIVCQIDSIQAGNHLIMAVIDGRYLNFQKL